MTFAERHDSYVRPTIFKHTKAVKRPAMNARQQAIFDKANGKRHEVPVPILQGPRS